MEKQNTGPIGATLVRVDQHTTPAGPIPVVVVRSTRTRRVRVYRVRAGGRWEYVRTEGARRRELARGADFAIVEVAP